MKDEISFEEYLEIEKKLEIQIGRVLTAERIPKSKKLLSLMVSFEVDGANPKSVVTNLGEHYEPEQFVGMVCPFITNLQPSTMMGVTSECMIVVGEDRDGKHAFSNYSVGTKLF